MCFFLFFFSILMIRSTHFKRAICFAVGVATLPLLAPTCLVTIPAGITWCIWADKKAEKDGRRTDRMGAVFSGLVVGTLPATVPLGLIALPFSSDPPPFLQ